MALTKKFHSNAFLWLRINYIIDRIQLTQITQFY